MTPTNEPTITEIRKRLASATPGTWYADGDRVFAEGVSSVPGVVPIEVAEFWDSTDAALTAHAPEDLRYLLELVQRLREGLKIIEKRLALTGDPEVDCDFDERAAISSVLPLIGALLAETEEKP